MLIIRQIYNYALYIINYSLLITDMIEIFSKRIIVIIILLILPISGFADRILNALSQLQKKEYAKAKSLLDKTLEKEPLNAGALHVYALYFFAEPNPAYTLDSAYLFVQRALENYPAANPKDTLDWAKKGISQAKALQLKADMEAKAYQNALVQNSVADWQTFIGKFAQAREVLLAIQKRNELMWVQTRQMNTVEAYQFFIENYPDAQQVVEARQRLDRLVYERETQSGKLRDLQKFVSQYPDNQHLNEAIQKMYFGLSLPHTRQVYQDFVAQFPAHPAAKYAWDWLYALKPDTQRVAQFLATQPNYYNRTYLEKIAQVIDLQYFPIYDNEAYGYVDETGKIQIQAELETVPKTHLCETIQTELFIFQKNNHLGLVDKLGKTVLEPIYDKIEVLSTGLFRVSKNAQQGVFHQSGREILPISYDLIEVLNPQLLKVRKNRRWGLVSMNGVVMVEPRFSEIDGQNGEFVIFRNGERFGVKTLLSLFRMISEKEGNIEIDLEKVEVIDNQHLKLERGGKYGILDKNNNWIFPLEQTQIIAIPKIGWATQSEGLWQLRNWQAQLISELQFEKFIAHSHYIAAKLAGKWGLLNAQGTVLQPFTADSMALVGDILLIFQAKKITAEFLSNPSAKPLDISALKNIRMEKSENPHSPVFLYVEDNTRKKNLYTQQGVKLLPNYVNNLYILDNEFINFQQNGKYGLVDSSGKVILNPKYDGISNHTGDYKILLNNGKYGLFSPSQKLLLEPNYEETPRFFGDSTQNYRFIARKNGYYGVVDLKNKNVLPFEFQAIQYWQDSTALAQDKKGKWVLYDFRKAKNRKIDSLSLKTSFEDLKMGAKTTQGEIIVQVKQNNLWGFWSNQRGEILKPQFEAINRLGKTGRPLWLAERKIERNRYEVSYLNYLGEIVWQKTMNELDYFRLLCE
jgi:hypothetical protein